MAHTCPECGLLCHCGGDIDDCEFDGTPEQDACSHCDDNDRECDDDPTELEDERQFREPIAPSASRPNS
jgi:hypothetical protein